MKKLILALMFFATPALAASDFVMHRDPGCGCCEKWAAQVRAAFGRNVRIIDDANRAAFDVRLGVPASLSGCHTAIIDGMTFEGHVPFALTDRSWNRFLTRWTLACQSAVHESTHSSAHI